MILQLPDPCLLAVLQFCVGVDPEDEEYIFLQDLCSIFSAARAHPRLQQAAVMALSRIDLYTGAQQHQADGMLKYLSII